MLNLKLILLMGALSAAAPAFAQPKCLGDWQHTAEAFEGPVTADLPLEATFSDQFSIAISKQKGSWSVLAQTQDGKAIPVREVRQGVAPVRGSNPKTIHYVFGPDVLDPALNPDLTVPGEGANIATVEPTPGAQGELWVYEDSTSSADDKAVNIQGCVRWHMGPREPDISHYPSAEMLVNFPGWVVLAFENCGLPQTLLLSGRMPRPGYRQRAWLEPDLDGDGLYDLVALVDDAETGQSGLAICSQTDRRLELVGFDHTGASVLSGAFLAEIDWWSVDGRTVVMGAEGVGSQRLFRSEIRPLVSEWISD